jgi:uncharacterized protein (TIGR00369 family)
MGTVPSDETLRVFNQAPFIALLGLRLDYAADGECKTSLTLVKDHLQHDGFVHAGVQATVADHTAGTAASTLLHPGQIVLSAEFKINLLRPALGKSLNCIAKVLKAGSTLIVVESEIYCGRGGENRLTAKATVTLVVVAKPA